MRSHLLLLTLLATAAACSDDGSPSDGPDAAPPPVLTTWHQDVAPIVAEHCMGCHTTGGIAPFSLETYEDTLERQDKMVEMVETNQMPPWDAIGTDDCNPRFGWQDDPRLTDAEKATLRAWLDDGAPEGDPATAAPLPQHPEQHLADPTHDLAPAVPFLSAGARDQMICFVMDPQITGPRWLNGIEFIPGNAEVVHHVVLAAVPPAQVAAVDALVGPDGYFDCFGGINVPDTYSLGVWVPGSTPFETGADIGIPIAAGTKVIMQIHYHPAMQNQAPDTTHVKLRVTDRRPGRNLIFTGVGNAFEAPALLPDPDDQGGVEFRIPAGIPDHIEQMVFPIALDTPERFAIQAVFPHMHYLGVDLEARIERATPLAGEPAEECLYKTPQWDFNWQRTYFYDAPVADLPTIGDGDVITLKCRYDNTLANPFVKRALEERGIDEPVDVYLGEETLDEMCLVGLAILF